VAELASLAGQELGRSDWFDITQQTVYTFADATGDHQWMHVDVERATAESPFGGPIAHGYLTLSLLVPLHKQILTVTDAGMTVNYGVNKVHFPAPVPVGSRIRMTASLLDVTEVTGDCRSPSPRSSKPTVAPKRNGALDSTIIAGQEGICSLRHPAGTPTQTVDPG